MKFFAFLLIFAVVATLASARQPLDKPNVIVIMLDDAGYTDFSHTGHPTIQTPAISRMAAEGLNFTQYYSASPACTASRYGTLTGRNPRRSGMSWVIGPESPRHIHVDEITIAEGLKARGYATGIFGKWHLGNPNKDNNFTPKAFPLAHGFDEWIGTNVSHDYRNGKLIRSNPEASDPIAGYETLATDLGKPKDSAVLRSLTRRYRDAAVSFIKKNKDQPFFAYITPNFPHLQISVSEDFAGQSPRGKFGDTMAEIDDLVGTIRRTLEEEKIAQNTLIIFTSDNGHWIRFQNTKSDSRYGEARINIGSAKPFRDGKGSTWEGGMRVAGVWCWPGTIPARRVVREPASSLDILPTAFALARATLSSKGTLDGRDIRPYLNPEKFSGDVAGFNFIYSGHGQNTPCAARQGSWKLHTHIYSQTGNNHGFAKNSQGLTKLDKPILFNLETDPGERHDLADDHPQIVSELEKTLSDFQSSVRKEKSFWD